MNFVHSVTSELGGIIGAVVVSGLLSPFIAMLVTGAVVSLIHYCFKGVRFHD